ncbi:AAA family ATPase [Sorangium sp. So ce1014]|uniref:AAA family ATPase n=1 Tax=Sorangium sp. So ce1014 TaxID=3133326 RepID=UPI003F5EBC98
MVELPHYTLRDKLYDSAGRVLYRGIRDEDGLPVVIKFLKDEHANPRDLAKLRHEFSILRELDWPGVIKAHALEVHEQSAGLVLEDVGETPLSEHLRGRGLDLAQALHVARALATILDGVHAHGVIHKDIKPANIVVDDRLQSVHLIDFSIATRLSQEAQTALRPDTLEGTLAYISPEQTGRMNRVVDYRTDFYSLGVTFYEMLTGVLPFDCTDPMEVVHSHIARTPLAPHERDPTIPEVVSTLAMKLLAKAAEDRYQRAEGLAADLERCLSEWQQKGRIAPFELGRRDVSERLQIPQKLYGRAAEIGALVSAFDRVSEGAAELALVTGAGGIGKSALVHELHKHVARRHGSFVAGKFDQLHREVPFAAFTQAIRALISHLLGESSVKLAAWRSALVEALGANGQLLVDLIPELELIVGPQPVAVALGPSESQSRLSLLMQSFVRVFCSPSHPLVLFFDDLQWADAASLWLLRQLLSGPGRGHLLVVGAYRDSEVDGAHPLRAALEELRKQGLEPSEIRLGPLDLPSVRLLLAETFKESEIERVEWLAAQAIAKTEGNPFFLSQFLLGLHGAKLVRLDRAAGRWVWDEAAIAAAPVTDNVVDFMATRIQALEPSTRRVLSLAACIGHQVDLTTLATIAELPHAQTAVALWPSLRDGLLLPIGGDYRLLPVVSDPDDLDPGALAKLDASYRFLHDRVQQAAYSLIPAEEREEVHLRIGRCLRRTLPDEPRAELAFELVRHLNLGAARMRDREERADLARQNLAAGRMAKAATAFASAAGLYAAGITALDEGSWEELYDLTFALHRERAECEYMAGRLDEAEAHLDGLLAHVRHSGQRGGIFGLRVTLYLAQARFAEALAAGRQGLALFGIDAPGTSEETQAACDGLLATIDELLAGRTIESLLDAPTVSDPDLQTCLQLLAELKVPAYFVEPGLYSYVVLKAVHLSLLQGNCRSSADIFVTFGFFLSGSLARYADSVRFGKLALDLTERFGATSASHRVFYVLGYLMPYGEPLRAALTYFERAKQLGLECGDLVHGSAATGELAAATLRVGEPLDRVRDEIQRGFVVTRRTQVVLASEMLTLLQQVVACLEGRTASPTSLSDGVVEEEAWVARLASLGMNHLRFYHLLTKMQLSLLHGDAAGAFAMIEAAEQLRTGAFGQHWPTELPFYAGLILAAVYPTAPAEEQPRLREALARQQERLAIFADACPANARHQQKLVAAEVARIEGRPSEAIDAYEQAIQLSRQHGFPHHEALANELCAGFFMARGQTRVAHVYVSEALGGYARWGAIVKVAQLRERYPSMVPAPVMLPLSASAVTAESTTNGTTGAQLLDVTAALRAAQAIASEIVLSRVVHRVMRIVLANAGAERGFLILNQGADLRVEAFLQVGPDTVQVGLNTPLESRADLAQSVVQLVARTLDPVVLSDARYDLRFAGDPYVISAQPRSLLCIPLTHQGRLRGVLYLENNVAQAAFTEGRIELLQMLCAQAAIAVENSLLYAHVQEVSAQLQEANRGLEKEVAERTEELRAANQHLQHQTEQLHVANGRLQHELAEREKAERSRAALQGEVIRMQSDLLEELSTPLIPITKQLMVLPLIGTVDRRRAERMLHTILQGVERHQARVVIIDVTGLKQIDVQVAETLIRATSALRLLGAEAVITGMRPEVARLLVELGVDLSRVETRGTLQSGIARAIGGLGRRR